MANTATFGPLNVQKALTDSVIVFFSCGKDSIVTLSECFRRFQHVYPVFMYLVPNLSFQEESLTWYENKFHTQIERIPHFELSNMLKYGSFCNMDYDVPIVGINDIYHYERVKNDCWWIAAGERINDSIIRRAMIKSSSSIDVKRGRFYPIAYWTKSDVETYIKKNKLKKDEFSQRMGFSFKSLEGRELAQIKRYYPEDYAKILDVFPFAEASVVRYEQYGK